MSSTQHTGKTVSQVEARDVQEWVKDYMALTGCTYGEAVNFYIDRYEKKGRDPEEGGPVPEY